MSQGNKTSRKSVTPGIRKGGGKTVGKNLKKTIPRKTIDWSKYKSSSDESDDEDDEDEDEDDEDEESANGDSDDDEEKEHYNLDGLYSLIGKSDACSADGDEKSNANNSSSESDDIFYSSSSDEDVDFVKLQIARARKGLKSKPKNDVAIASDSESESETEQADVSTELKPKPRRKSSIKYGRRRSDAVLPELKFEFGTHDQGDEEVIEEFHAAPVVNKEEEDLGEDLGEEVEVNFTANIPLDAFDFDHQLMDVPRIGEDELNSDADYEFNEDELIATLAENEDDDADELLNTPTNNNTPTQASRHNSVSSSNVEDFDDDDDDNDPFLKEEEKFLVHEFEINGFDEEEEIDDFDLFEADFDTNKPIVKYESNHSSTSDDELINLDFNTNTLKKNKNHHSEDFDDNTYLFNYFFSSENDSSGDEGADISMADADELFREGIGHPGGPLKIKNEDKKSPAEASEDSSYDLHKTLFDNEGFDGYESGESTEEELDLPQPNKKIQSFTKPSEVISNGADPRPPVIGTWVTSNYRPFKVIDGSSVLSLVSPQNHPRKSIIVQSPHIPSSEDLAIGLDELLNVELIDDGNIDENDIKIWREFNNDKKKKIPLGAFRNKSVLYNNSNSHHHSPVLLNNDAKFSGNNSVKKPTIRRKRHHSRSERASITKLN
ncbi:Transcriptional regulator IFH1 [Candida viswanathii]|uniref:Transcriptional regulator IFH1 n=1 Tax=Candida viswanathii TaxID=5486 RepID=A0A367YG45_9ASCO|nr:Transcriptional regulator IFH1 [Candida viswanathii]